MKIWGNYQFACLWRPMEKRNILTLIWTRQSVKTLWVVGLVSLHWKENVWAKLQRMCSVLYPVLSTTQAQLEFINFFVVCYFFCLVHHRRAHTHKHKDSYAHMHKHNMQHKHNIQQNSQAEQRPNKKKTFSAIQNYNARRIHKIGQKLFRGVTSSPPNNTDYLYYKGCCTVIYWQGSLRHSSGLTWVLAICFVSKAAGTFIPINVYIAKHLSLELGFMRQTP